QGTKKETGDLLGETGLAGAASGVEMDKVYPNPNPDPGAEPLGDGGGSPPNIQILATGTNDCCSGADIAYYTTPAGGFVFSAGSITFGGSLVVSPDLQTILRNVLDGELVCHVPASVSQNLAIRRSGDTIQVIDSQSNVVVAAGPVG